MHENIIVLQYISPYKLFNCSSLEVLQMKVNQFGDLNSRYADLRDDDPIHILSTKMKKKDLQIQIVLVYFLHFYS